MGLRRLHRGQSPLISTRSWGKTNATLDRKKHDVAEACGNYATVNVWWSNKILVSGLVFLSRSCIILECIVSKVQVETESTVTLEEL